jgi:hypothetical protein
MAPESASSSSANEVLKRVFSLPDEVFRAVRDDPAESAERRETADGILRTREYERTGWWPPSKPGGLAEAMGKMLGHREAERGRRVVGEDEKRSVVRREVHGLLAHDARVRGLDEVPDVDEDAVVDLMLAICCDKVDFTEAVARAGPLDISPPVLIALVRFTDDVRLRGGLGRSRAGREWIAVEPFVLRPMAEQHAGLAKVTPIRRGARPTRSLAKARRSAAGGSRRRSASNDEDVGGDEPAPPGAGGGGGGDDVEQGGSAA